MLKGEEETLKVVEREWNNVHLQTNWKLEACFKPTDANDIAVHTVCGNNVVAENMVHQHPSAHHHLSSSQSNPVLQSSHNHNDNITVDVAPQTLIDQHVSVNSPVLLSKSTDEGQVESDIQSPSYSSSGLNPSSSVSYSFLDPK